MKKMLAAAVLAVSSLAANAAVTPTNIVVNGSFEQAAKGFSLPGNGGWGVYGDGSLLGWRTSIGQGVEVQYNAAGKAQSGNYLIELDSDFGNHIGTAAAKGAGTNSNIWQDLSTVKGATYSYSFWYAARPGTTSGSNGISYVFGDVAGSKPITGTGGSSTAWTQYTGSFVASSTTSRISFLANGAADGYGGFIDNVSVVQLKVPTPAVPEPETYALMGLGLAGVLLARKKRRA